MITRRTVVVGMAGTYLAACAPAPAPAPVPVQAVEQNPALRRLKQRNDPDLGVILSEIDRILKSPPKPLTRGGAAATAREKRLIFENKLLREAYEHDAKAALKLIRVIVPKLEND